MKKNLSLFPASPEPLEPRIAPAALLTFSDVDGDLVTVKSSHGTNDQLDEALNYKFVNLTDAQLLLVDLTVHADVFAGTDLTITAKRAPGGDGLVHVGAINATGLDLGRVKISGDLGRFTAGDNAPATVGVVSLEVGSLGALGVGTQPSGGSLVSVVTGSVGQLTVHGDINEASFTADQLGVVAISGSLAAGGDPGTGSLISKGSVQSLTIRGSLLGKSDDSGQVKIGGSVGSVNIKGSLLGGTAPASGSLRISGSAGTVRVGGDLYSQAFGSGAIGIFGGGAKSISIRGSVYAGVNSNADGGLELNGDVGQILIGGDFHGGLKPTRDDLQVAGSLGLLRVGGSIIGHGASLAQVNVGGALGTVIVKGDLAAANGTGVVITAAGSAHPTPGHDVAIGRISIGGSVTNSLIAAGFAQYSSARQGKGGVNADAQIGSVRIGGDVSYSSIIAGLNSGPGIGDFGNGDEFALSGAGVKNAADTVSRIASVVIGGKVLGPQDPNRFGGIEAEEIGSFRIGGFAIPLKTGSKDVVRLSGSGGMTGNYFVREV